MSSPDPIPTTLPEQLRHLGLMQTATDLNDLVARATQKRWSPVLLLEAVARAELDARARQRVERRLKEARIGRFKPMVDFEWAWPKLRVPQLSMKSGADTYSGSAELGDNDQLVLKVSDAAKRTQVAVQ